MAIDPIECTVADGGAGGVPSIDMMSLDLAISNEGARAGVITRVDLKNVSSVGWPELAEGATEVGYWMPTVADAGSGTKLHLPRTITAGEVGTVRLSFKLTGAVHTASNTTPTPDLAPIARGLAKLRRVDLEARVVYRRAALFGSRATTETLETISIEGSVFRGKALSHWERAGRPDLVELAGGKPG